MLTKFRIAIVAFALLFAAGSAAQAQGAAPADPNNPVVRGVGGNWGMQFSFGGLGTMAATNQAIGVGTFAFTQAGMRMMLNDQVVIPLFFGFGARIISPEGQDSNSDIGFLLGGGLEYHFRIWRRISPFVGGNLTLAYTNPTGDNNWTFAVQLAPTLGIEYFWGDRVSFIAQYFLSFNFVIQDQAFTFLSGTHTQNSNVAGGTLAGGGQLSMVFYF